MPSPAAQRAYDEILKKKKENELPEEALSRLRVEASGIVDRVSSRSKLFDKDKEDTFPRFQIDGMSHVIFLYSYESFQQLLLLLPHIFFIQPKRTGAWSCAG